MLSNGSIKRLSSIDEPDGASGVSLRNTHGPLAGSHRRWFNSYGSNHCFIFKQCAMLVTMDSLFIVGTTALLAPL